MEPHPCGDLFCVSTSCVHGEYTLVYLYPGLSEDQPDNEVRLSIPETPFISPDLRPDRRKLQTSQANSLEAPLPRRLCCYKTTPPSFSHDGRRI